MSESLKESLVQNIEAYAASKEVRNQLLQEWAARMMSQFLDSLVVSVPELQQNEAEDPEASPEQASGVEDGEPVPPDSEQHGGDE